MKRLVYIILVLVFSALYASANIITIDGTNIDWDDIPMLTEPGAEPVVKMVVPQDGISLPTGAALCVMTYGRHDLMSSQYPIIYADADKDKTTGTNPWYCPNYAYDYEMATWSSGSSYGASEDGCVREMCISQSAFDVIPFTGSVWSWVSFNWGELMLPSTPGQDEWRWGENSYHPYNVAPYTYTDFANTHTAINAYSTHQALLPGEALALGQGMGNDTAFWASWAVELKVPTIYNVSVNVVANNTTIALDCYLVNVSNNQVVATLSGEEFFSPQGSTVIGSWDLSSVPEGKYMLKVKNRLAWADFSLSSITFQPEQSQYITCSEAVTICQETGTTATTETYTIRGYVTSIKTAYSEEYGNITFGMADTQTGGQILQAYRVRPLTNTDIQVKEGDYVEVVGTLINYLNTTPEVNAGGSYTILNASPSPENKCGDNLYWTLQDSTLIITGSGAMYDYYSSENIPWNDLRSSIKNVSLPNGMTSIAFSSFYQCENLRSITIPNSVTNIAETNPFDYCPSLVSIEVMSGNTTYDSREGCNAIIETATNTLITGCQNTTIPQSVTSIGNYAFAGCSNLNSINIHKNILSIGIHSFGNCYAVTSIIVEDGNAVYDSREGCNAIIETATNTLMVGCQTTVIPSTITTIGDYAFSNRTSNNPIVIPNGVTTINAGAFWCCRFESITIPESVTSIGRQAFAYSSSLTSIYVKSITPPTLGSNDVFTSKPTCYIPVGTLAAYQASDWASQVGSFVEQGSTTTPASNYHNFEDASLNAEWQFIQDGQTNYWTIGTAAGSASTGSNALYITNDGSNYAYTIGSSSVSWAYIPISITENDALSFYWKGIAESCCDYLYVYLMPIGSLPTAGSTTLPEGTITLTNKLNQISEWQSFSTTGYKGDYNLCFMWRNDGSAGETPVAVDNVSIGENTPPASTTGQCGDNLFWEYNNGTLTITGTGAMYDFSDDEVPWKDFRGTITTVSLPQGLTTIGTYAFAHCRVLSSITLPNTVTIIGDYAFYDCDALINMVIPESVTTIGNNAFLYCDGLTNVTLPSGITAVEDNAFASCPSLTTITIPNGVTTIGNYAFYDCDALTTVNMPNTLITIGNYAFANCDVLSGITIPNSVTTIGNNAFYSCSALTAIHVEATTPPTIGSNLFSSAPTCYIPCGTLSVYQASDWASQVGSFEEECAGTGEPVEMTGVVKRALQMGENVVVLTHETDGTAHIYNIVGGFAYEISQQGIIARDPENAGDYLAISDIALTEDGKLVACNYVRCQYSADQVDVGYKRGTNYFYMWDTLASDPHVWFTSQDAANSYRSDAGYTFAVNGPSQDCQVLVSKRHYSATSGGGALRLSCYTVIDGTISHIYYGHSISASDNPPMDASRDGENIQFTLSPRGEKDFIFDAEKVTPMEFRLPEGQNQDVIIVGQTSTDLLNVKFNGSTYFNYAGYSLMTAPKTDADGKVIGVQVLNITDGLDAATEVVSANLNVAIEATAIATAVNVVNDRLVITLVADATIYILNVELQIESDAITYELNGGVTNDYGWMTKNDMFQACMEDCGVTELPSLDEIKALADPFMTICSKLTDVTRMLNAEKWDWLETYIMSVQNADASATALTEGTTSAGWRYALAAFFLETKRTSWPVSADFSQAGTVQAFMPAWQHGFANPTAPTTSFVLNAPYKEGYTFGGWYTNATFSGSNITTVNASTTGTLYAKWIEGTAIPTTNAHICYGETYTWEVNGETYSSSGVYDYSVYNEAGELMHWILNLTVSPAPVTEEETITIAASELPYIWRGVTIAEAGSYVTTEQSINGCDSVIHELYLIVEANATVYNAYICYGETYTWEVNGIAYSESGIYTYSDSWTGETTAILNLTVAPAPIVEADSVFITENELPYIWRGYSIAEAGNYVMTEQSIHGCDSILYELYLTVEASGTSGLTYNVTVPAGTSACYIAGDMNGWTFTEMTKVNNTHFTITIEGATTDMTYKYCSGPAWEYVEKDAYGSEISARTYSTNDVVQAWANIYQPLPTTPASDYHNFEDASLNAEWQFVQDGQTNYWTIGTAAGSTSGGSNALYITNDGYNYSYNNSAVSVSWAYIPVELVSTDTIAFNWKGQGESSYDNMRVYLYPIGTLPTAGSSTIANDAVQVTSTYLCGQSDWQTFAAVPGMDGTFNLCFMWKNDGSAGSTPIAVDEVRIAHFSAPANPENQCGDNLYWAYSNGTLTITGSGAMYDGNDLLTYHQQSWFPDEVTRVNLPNGMTHIGATAFADCSNLTSISIPSSVVSIGEAAFAWSGLQTLTLPEGVQDIDDMVFANCSNLTKFIYRGTPDELGNATTPMFLGCNQLDTIIAPARMWDCPEPDATVQEYYGFPSHIRYIEVTGGELSATNISYMANSSRTLLTLDISSASNNALPNQAFINWTALETLRLPANLTEIPYQIAYACENLKAISIPSYVAVIGDEAFRGCSKLSSIDFADSQNLYSIGQYAFAYCSALLSVEVPEGVQTLGAYAFRNTGLVQLRLPSTLSVIGNYTFYNCSHLLKMNVAAYTPPTVSSYTFYNVPRTAKVYVPESVVNTYKSTAVWREFFIESNVQDAVDNILTEGEEQTQKLFINGQVIIIRNGKSYNLMGQEL